MISLIKEKVSIGFIIIISLIIAVAPSLVGDWSERKEKKRLFLLNQVNTYGTLYYIYHTGSPKELARYLKESAAYIDEEDINIFYSIVEGAEGVFPFSNVDWGESPIIMRKDYDEKLAKMLLKKYKEKLNIYRDKYF